MGLKLSTITLQVMHDESLDVSAMSLERIGQEIDEGDALGQWSVKSVVDVEPSRAEEQMRLLGNDGTFFELQEEEKA